MCSRDLGETVGTPRVVKCMGRHSESIAEGTETEDRLEVTGNPGKRCAVCRPMFVWAAHMCFPLPRLWYCEVIGVLDTKNNKMWMVRK